MKFQYKNVSTLKSTQFLEEELMRIHDHYIPNVFLVDVNVCIKERDPRGCGFPRDSGGGRTQDRICKSLLSRFLKLCLPELKKKKTNYF